MNKVYVFLASIILIFFVPFFISVDAMAQQCIVYRDCPGGPTTCGYYTDCSGGTAYWGCGANQYPCASGCCNVGSGQATICECGVNAKGNCRPCCTPSCKNKTCGSNGCGGSCGTCSLGTYCLPQGTVLACCATTIPDQPVLTAPIEVYKGIPMSFSWNQIANWGGNQCTNTGYNLTLSNSYAYCIGDKANNCAYSKNIVGSQSDGTVKLSSSTTQASWTPTIGDGSNVYFTVFANNNVLAMASETKIACAEGFRVTSTSYVSRWSNWSITCTDVSQVRTATRTCVEDCNKTNPSLSDCATYFGNTTLFPTSGDDYYTYEYRTTSPNANKWVQTRHQSCKARIETYLFDASDFTNASQCPSIQAGLEDGTLDPLTIKNVPLKLYQGTQTTPYAEGTTDETGLYTAFVANNKTYRYDTSNDVNINSFVGLAEAGVLSFYPKITCGSNPTATLQPADVVRLDFGFDRVTSGWWQVVGGGITALQDVFSKIPAMANTANQRLILGDANRYGLVTYGGVLNTGYNIDTKVSDKLFAYNQTYEGRKYDYNYFKDKLAGLGVDWDGTEGTMPAMDASGYKILTYTGSDPMNLSLVNAISGKYILLIDGSVNVNTTIKVNTGGFLAVIASETIAFKPDVVDGAGNNSFDGWYVANILDTGTTGDTTTELQFQGNGSFVAWSDFKMVRDLGDRNNTMPAEKFTYRPDMLDGAPDVLKEPYKFYQKFNQ